MDSKILGLSIKVAIYILLLCNAVLLIGITRRIDFYFEYKKAESNRNAILKCNEYAAITDNPAWTYKNCLEAVGLLDNVRSPIEAGYLEVT